jgi:hypothetical protein
MQVNQFAEDIRSDVLQEGRNNNLQTPSIVVPCLLLLWNAQARRITASVVGSLFLSLPCPDLP